MKIDIYTLLGMIKDGKAPKKIKYNKYLDRIGGKDIYEEEIYIYDKKEKNYYRESDEKHEYWTTAFMIIPDLEDEVEILETTITYNQDNYYQYQPYTGEVEIKCNSSKNLLGGDKIYNQDNRIDRIEKIDIDGYALSPTGVGKIEFTISEKILANKINEIIDYINGEQT